MKKAVTTAVLSAPVILLTLASLYCSMGNIGRPFGGFLVYPNLLVSPLYLPWWIPPQENVIYPWALDSVDSVSIRSSTGLEAILSRTAPGEVHIFTFSQGEQRTNKGLPIAVFRASDFWGVCGPMGFTALALSAIGIFLLFRVPWSAASWSVFFLCQFLGGWMGTHMDWMVSHRIPWALLLTVSMTPASAMAVALLYPSPAFPLGRRGYFIVLSLLAALGLGDFILFTQALPSPQRYARVDTLNAGLIGLSVIGIGFRLMWSAASPRAADRAAARTVILWGLSPFAFAMIPFAAFLYFFHIPYGLFTFSMPLAVLPPAAMAWALKKTSMG